MSLVYTCIGRTWFCNWKLIFKISACWTKISHSLTGRQICGTWNM